MPLPFAPPSSPPRPISALQLGKSWFTPTTGGGLDRMFDGLMRHLPDAGVTCHGLVTGASRVDGAPATIRGVSPEDASGLERLLAFRALTRSALPDVDLVAAHFALYAAPFVSLFSDTPFVVHFHGPWGQESAVEGDGRLKVAFKSRIERAVYQRADRFIVLSEAFRDVLTETFGVDPEQIRIVPGGIDPERFAVPETRTEARRRLNLPTDRPVAVSVRRLARRMGLEVLVDAWTEVCRRCPDALLLVAGKGPLAADLQARIESRGLTDHVRLLGFVPDADLPLLYRAANVSVLPTAALEGFGLTSIESLAAGTPVLVTPVGGLPETVRELSTDLVLPGATAPILADALAGAFTGALSLPTAEACRAHARQRFSWSSIATQTRTVYDEVL